MLVCSFAKKCLVKDVFVESLRNFYNSYCTIVVQLRTDLHELRWSPKKSISSTEQSRLLTEVQENNCFEHLWIFHGKHIRDHSFGRYAKSSKKLNPLIRTPLWRNFSIKQIFNNKRKRFSIKFTYVLNEWVSLRIQSECGKTRTRKNSVFGHFSRSKISIQKQSPVSVL